MQRASSLVRREVAGDRAAFVEGDRAATRHAVSYRADRHGATGRQRDVAVGLALDQSRRDRAGGAAVLLFYNEKRFEEGAALLAEDFVNHHPGTTGHGRRGMIDDFGAAARSMPDFRIEVRRIAQEQDHVWTHSIIEGLPGGARALSVDIWRFKDALIAEHWDVGQRLQPGQELDGLA